eukprot:TRINITY_DN9823_c0_g2_i1.p1 TRINITY_DN9823_c0_g2~~TRINITY_DN9823_c0_g2_i1.p1  ORF type:complete len:393 (+),score=149.20 TRINITY_DN9823_c0_g2_i1:91-1269(+)
MVKAQQYLEGLSKVLSLSRTPWGRGQNAVAIVGICSDANSRFRRGCRDAPMRIREAFHSSAGHCATEAGKEIVVYPVEDLSNNAELSRKFADEQRADLTQTFNVLDFGNLEFDEEDEATPGVFFDSIKELCRLINEHNICPITLGGDHSLSYPMFSGLLSTPRKSVGTDDSGDHRGGSWSEEGDNTRNAILPHFIQFDAHPDTFPEVAGNPLSNGSQMARILELEMLSHVTQFGIRSTTAEQNNFLKDFPNVEQLPMQLLHVNTPKERADLVHRAMMPKQHASEVRSATYISIDMSVLDPSCAPGVSHPEPGGLTTRELVHMVQSIPSRQRLVGVDLTEVNPLCDFNDATALAAAKILKELIPKASQRSGQMAKLTLPEEKPKPAWPWKRND